MNTLQAVMGLMLMGSGGLSTPIGSASASIPEIRNTPEAVILRVSSNGCTRKQDFRIQTNQQESLKVIRLRKDRCRQRPEMVEFQFSHEELGINPPLTGGRLAGN